MGNPITGYRIQFGISFGSEGWKIGPSIEIDHRFDSFAMAYGVGFTYYSDFYKTNKSGWELRSSFMAGYSNLPDKGINKGETEFMLGTNQFIGFGGIREFDQRTGIVSVRQDDFRFTYENDGMPFGHLGLGDGNDRYRTAAASISLGNIALKTNLFTGLRDKESFEIEKNLPGGEKGIPEGEGEYGETYDHGFVWEKGPRYRYGGLVLNIDGKEVGFNSEWIRHAFQNKFAHHYLSPQRQFKMLSDGWIPIGQPAPVNSRFTTW